MPVFTGKPSNGLKVTKERAWETTIHIEPIVAQGRHCQVETTKRDKRAHEKAPQEEHLLPSLTVFA